jgi:hypothetical protein
MCWMNERTPARVRSGYVISLIGALAFVVSCFLPYEEILTAGAHGTGSDSVSFYRVLSLGQPTPLTRAGAFLFLFAGAATTAWIAVEGIRRGPRWAPSALFGASIAWSLTWLGLLLNQSRFSDFSTLLAGYWALLVSVGVVAVGAIAVWVSARPGRRPRLRDQPVPGE